MAVVGLTASAQAEAADEELRHRLWRATQYVDNPRGSWASVRYAIQLSGGNTNRVVSLMKQLIEEGTDEDGTAQFYISEIGKYGTSADLPFLYQKVSATNLCEQATVAVLNIEGLSTNALTRLTVLIPDIAPGVWSRAPAHAWRRLLDAAAKLPSGAGIRNLTVSNAIVYASRQTKSVQMLDEGIIATDLGYRMSKRRLAVLRAVQNLGVNEWQTNFVATAIRELEDYPEADLPE